MDKYKKLIDDAAATVEDHINFMTKNEIDMIFEFRGLCEKFRKMIFKLPEDKKILNPYLIFPFKRNFEEFCDSLFLPYNKAGYVIVRVCCENYIILKFLMQNDAKYTKNWFYYMIYEINEKVDTEGLDDYHIWISEFQKEILNEKLLKSLKNNPYGWAYPITNEKLTLKTISWLADDKEEYETFQQYSKLVHSNNALQSQNSINYGEHTFNCCVNLAVILQKTLKILNEYCVSNEEDKNEINDNLLCVFKEYQKFERKRKRTLKKIFEMETKK